ncbi:hypothetical protein RRF57_003738 [Xylaria bambusicola]|uniref:Uncharacterized protein n=1 Tax=Xylaria bambusicola TaxID=326684 RepID=A0AAN7UHZ3_9PEZI
MMCRCPSPQCGPGRGALECGEAPGSTLSNRTGSPAAEERSRQREAVAHIDMVGASWLGYRSPVVLPGPRVTA